MLDERLVDLLVERFVNRIEAVNTYVLEEIAKNIKQIRGLTASNSYQLQQTLKYGGNYENIVAQLSKITNLNVNEIEEVFEEVAKNDYAFAKQFYDFKGVNYVPYEENTALKKQVQALANITKNTMSNFSRSNALGYSIRNLDGKIEFVGLRETYNRVIDEAVLSVSQGKETFDTAMTRIIKDLGKSGIKTVEYGDRSIRLDSMVRQHLKGALRNLHNETQNLIGQEFGADGVEISVHINPAPDHAEVQGRQFSKEEFEKFQNDQDAVDYTGKLFPAEHEGHDRRSISEYNCYHYTFDIVLGVSKPQYSTEQLKQIIDNNNKGFELDGDHYTNYEGTQMQRQLETEIRKQKDIQIMAKASGNKELVEEAQSNISQLSKKYKQLSEASGLPTQAERLKVSGYKRISIAKMN